MPPIFIVDTTVLLNVLDVPGRNRDRDVVLDRLGELVDDGASLLLPMGAIFETGNHIARLPDGQQRRDCAEVLRDQVRQALDGQAPWAPLQFPDARQLAEWLEGFPDYAMQEISMVDLSIIKAWQRTCVQHPARRVAIWTLDQHLIGYDRIP
ncbi:MAG: hypothetical protein F4137_17000 [Acidobacteria bacterium]|nr:hypothetical protein [Acidobacteriota bacterium]MYH30498.1 hypothetical protein [Acidobacteriota bacterium]